MACLLFTGGGNPAKLNHLPQDIMDARRDAHGSPAADFPKNQAEVGKVVDVLIEQENPERVNWSLCSVFAGWFSLRPRWQNSMMVPVVITDADTYDLYGQSCQ